MNAKLITASILTTITATIIALALFINHREALVLDGSVQLPMLQKPVQVYFDKLAIPYIEARSEKDLIVAQGYITASQRLFQMDILRRLARGETAAIFGSTCLANDKLAHIIGFKRVAEAEYGLLAPETQKWLRSYCQGVNAYISQNKLPLEFILLGYEPLPWQPEDTLAILKYLQYASDECWQINVLQDAINQKAGQVLAKQMFGNSYKLASTPVGNPDPSEQSNPDLDSKTENESNDQKGLNHPSLKKQEIHQSPTTHIGWQNNSRNCNPLYPNVDLWKLVASLPPASQFYWGSNGWAISANLSKSKTPLIACDKDTLFSFPDLFFLSSLRAPFIHVAGISIPGIPGILIGRNEKISWAAINLKRRSQELCFEQFSDKFPDRYKNSCGSFKAQVLQEEIGSRFSASRMEKITITKDGPLLTKNGPSGIALNWYGSNPNNNSIESIWPINKAKSWSDFSGALEKYRSSPQTFLYADTTGDIAEYIAGHNVHSGQILSKQTSENQTGESNNAPDFIIANHSKSSPSTSLQAIINSTASSNSASARRINYILESNRNAKTKLALEDLIAIQGDCKASLTESVTKTIGKALSETKNTDQYENDAIALLNKWDGQLKADSICATIYESFLIQIIKDILQPRIGEQLTNEYINRWPYWTQFIGQILNDKPANLLPQNIYNFDIFNLNCLSKSLKGLRLVCHSGPLPGHMQKFQWQKLHQLDFRENVAKFIPEALANFLTPLIPYKIGLGGDQDCVNACNYQVNSQTPFYMCNSGPTARLLIDMADNDKFYHSLVFGQSGHLFSKDRIDNNQLNSWRNMEYHAIAFSSKQLEQFVRHNLTLSNQLE